MKLYKLLEDCTTNTAVEVTACVADGRPYMVKKGTALGILEQTDSNVRNSEVVSISVGDNKVLKITAKEMAK